MMRPHGASFQYRKRRPPEPVMTVRWADEAAAGVTVSVGRYEATAVLSSLDVEDAIYADQGLTFIRGLRLTQSDLRRIRRCMELAA